MTTGQLLKKYRKARGLTQAQFAEQLSVSTVTFNRLERDILEPSGGVLKALSAVLAKDEMDEFLNTTKSSGPQNVATANAVDRLSMIREISAAAIKNVSDQLEALGWSVLLGTDRHSKPNAFGLNDDLVVSNSDHTKRWVINYCFTEPNRPHANIEMKFWHIFSTKANKFSVVLTDSQACILFCQRAVAARDNFNCDISLLLYDPELKKVVAEWEIATNTTGSGFFDLDSTDDEIRTAAEKDYMAWKRSLNSVK